MNATGHVPLWTKPLVVIGSIGLLAGALDPLEGSVAILIGSGLVALGTFIGHGERSLIRYRALVFLLIAIGVTALWSLSAVGGFGGESGLSMWWGLLILPYFIGYPLAIVGPGNPRWFLWLGIGVGLWYLALCGMVLSNPGFAVPLLVIGVLTSWGCIIRLANATGHTPPSPLARGE